jgi:hypothetical protein
MLQRFCLVVIKSKRTDGNFLPEQMPRHGEGRMDRQRVLFLCTHNSARSQMAEAFLRSLAGDRFEAASAGTEATRVHPLALRVMAEVGIDLSRRRSGRCATTSGPTFESGHRPWRANGQSLHCQPGFGWNTPAPIACSTSATRPEEAGGSRPGRAGSSGGGAPAAWSW